MTNTAKPLHESRDANQVLDETVKVRDVELNAIEEIVKKLREDVAQDRLTKNLKSRMNGYQQRQEGTTQQLSSARNATLAQTTL